ncbi:MAG: HAD family hydrolase [Deltaproteobacteria bacterium]|nr:HAD family hydrolase [Deltaproteobacteria bacterium]
MLKMVVFDLDDTLYLERNYSRSGFNAVGNQVLSEWNRDDFADIAWELFQHGERGNIFDLALQRSGVNANKQQIAALVELFRNHSPEIDLEVDAINCLRHIPSHITTGLITDGYKTGQRLKIHALSLENSVDHIIITDKYGREFWKPHPFAFKRLESAAQTEGKNCVYIGDNPKKDFTAPNARGWTTIRIKRPLSLHVELPSPTYIDAEISELSKLWPLLDTLS